MCVCIICLLHVLCSSVQSCGRSSSTAHGAVNQTRRSFSDMSNVCMHPAQVQLKLIIDSIVWAFRHTERNVAETGLNLLLDMLNAFSTSDFATQFYQTYYLQLIQVCVETCSLRALNADRWHSDCVSIPHSCFHSCNHSTHSHSCDRAFFFFLTSDSDCRRFSWS